VEDLGPELVAGITATGQRLIGNTLAGEQQAAVLTPGQPSTLLGTLPGGTFSRANGANDTGAVVGYSGTGPFSLHTHAFIWREETGMQDLGTLGTNEQLFSAATAINDTGTVVGYADVQEDTPVQPAFWAYGQGFALDTLGGPGGSADDVNAAGRIVGDTQLPDGSRHATLWDQTGVPQDLHPAELPGTSTARAVNRRGWVVGALTTAGTQVGYLWRPGIGMLALPPLPGHVRSLAWGINRRGLVVGESFPAPGPDFPPAPPTAVLWGRDMTPVDLHSLTVGLPPDVHLHTAVGVADNGAIVVWGTSGERRHSFLLRPQP
jgi:probable HAF family extracellular repeat protein